MDPIQHHIDGDDLQLAEMMLHSGASALGEPGAKRYMDPIAVVVFVLLAPASPLPPI